MKHEIDYQGYFTILLEDYLDCGYGEEYATLHALEDFWPMWEFLHLWPRSAVACYPADRAEWVLERED